MQKIADILEIGSSPIFVFFLLAFLIFINDYLKENHVASYSNFKKKIGDLLLRNPWDFFRKNIGKIGILSIIFSIFILIYYNRSELHSTWSSIFPNRYFLICSYDSPDHRLIFQRREPFFTTGKLTKEGRSLLGYFREPKPKIGMSSLFLSVDDFEFKSDPEEPQASGLARWGGRPSCARPILEEYDRLIKQEYEVLDKARASFLKQPHQPINAGWRAVSRDSSDATTMKYLFVDASRQLQPLEVQIVNGKAKPPVATPRYKPAEAPHLNGRKSKPTAKPLPPMASTPPAPISEVALASPIPQPVAANVGPKSPPPVSEHKEDNGVKESLEIRIGKEFESAAAQIDSFAYQNELSGLANDARTDILLERKHSGVRCLKPSKTARPALTSAYCRLLQKDAKLHTTISRIWDTSDYERPVLTVAVSLRRPSK